jgi:hypothetical protein
MRLVLSVGEKVIAFAPVDAKRVNSLDYINAKMRLLKSIHKLTLATFKEAPVFYLHAPSKFNDAGKVSRRAGKKA